MSSKLFWFLFKGLKLGITKRFLKLNMSLKQFKKLLQKPFQLKDKDLQFATFQLNKRLFISLLDKKEQKNKRSNREE